MSLEENKLESVILIDDLIVKKVLIVPDGIPWYIRLKLKFNMALNNVLNKIIDNNFKYIMNIINGIFFGINFVFGIIVHLCRSFDRLHSLYEMYGVFFAIIGIYLMYEIIHSLVGKKKRALMTVLVYLLLVYLNMVLLVVIAKNAWSEFNEFADETWNKTKTNFAWLAYLNVFTAVYKIFGKEK
ncbi:hypothetical protein GVAV_000511 [Gurleya vavrai]